MRKFFCISLLMLIVLIVFADPPDPNKKYDYDFDSNGDQRASALASEHRGNKFEYFGQGTARNTGSQVVEFLVSWSLGVYHDSLPGTFWGEDGTYLSASTTFKVRSSAGGYGSCRYASASAGVP